MLTARCRKPVILVSRTLARHEFPTISVLLAGWLFLPKASCECHLIFLPGCLSQRLSIARRARLFDIPARLMTRRQRSFRANGCRSDSYSFPIGHLTDACDQFLIASSTRCTLTSCPQRPHSCFRPADSLISDVTPLMHNFSGTEPRRPRSGRPGSR